MRIFKNLQIATKIQTMVIALALLIGCGRLQAEKNIQPPRQKHSSSFAIFVDAQTFSRTGEAVQAYRDAVENDGLSAYILADEWRNPEEIRQEIRRLSKATPPLEGVVFIGDIPVPMVRDAQHLTSAFKMDQERFSMKRSSIPSDRFYDDFDLKFDFLRQDTTNSLLFYYSLRPDSPQKIERDIYSARITAPAADSTKYEMIRSYLQRVARQKNEAHTLDHALMVTGHGYYSESLTAWKDESLALREQFPQLFSSGGSLKAFYHTMDEQLKQRVLKQLQFPELDMALFHAHGSEELQYMVGSPTAEHVTENIERIKYYLRGKLRQARRRKQSLEAARKYFTDKYGVPDAWFAGAFDDSLMAADSVAEYEMDIHAADIRKISPRAEFVMFDECFNGAFIHQPYIAGEYVLGSGSTIAAVANSVNVLQDLWPDEFLGLLNAGVRVGRWHQTRTYLESHIIGDPTFRFSAVTAVDVNRLLLKKNSEAAVWNELLSSDSVPLRSLAVDRLFKIRGREFETGLLDIYRRDSSFILRLRALKCLAELRTPAFEELLKTSVADPYELVRRFSVKLMGDVGRPDYLPLLVERLYEDPAKRVNSAAWDAISKIGAGNSVSAARNLFAELDFPDPEQQEILSRLQRKASYDSSWIFSELLPNIKNDTLALKKRIGAVRTFRNYRFEEALPDLTEAAVNPSLPPELRAAVLEALGWFGFSYQRDKITNACDRILEADGIEAMLRDEARRTKKRIAAGANNPLTP